MPNKGTNSRLPLQLVSGNDISSPANSRLDIAGSLSEGVLTVHKTLVFKVPDGMDPRGYNATDVFQSDYFPDRYSLLDEDPRLYFTGDAEITHFSADSKYIEVDLTYQSFASEHWSHDNSDGDTDVDGNKVTKDTPPWKLRPQEVRFFTASREVAWRFAYDRSGKMFDRNGHPTNPVINSAKQPLRLMGKHCYSKLVFTFFKKHSDWSYKKTSDFDHTVNSNTIKVCGKELKPGTALLENLSATRLVTYKKDSTKVKWRYWKIDVDISIDPTGRAFREDLLDVGDRAYFGPAPLDLRRDDFFITEAAKYFSDYGAQEEGDKLLPIAPAPFPQQIVTFHPYAYLGINKTTGRIIAVPDPKKTVWCGWQQFINYRELVMRIADFFDMEIPDPQCEQMHDIPLGGGYVNYGAMQSGLYPLKPFWLHPLVKWSSIGLPSK